jgi:hypothetical protein
LNPILRSFGLAFKGVFHPWVIWLTIRPFLIAAVLWLGILWFIWTPLLDWMRTLLTTSSLANWITATLSNIGWNSVRAVVAPYFSVVILMPLVIVSVLILVSFTSVNSVLRHVERQVAYLDLKKEYGGNFLGSLWVTITSTCIFLILVLVSLPIWWIPPVFAFIPPILWGWLTTQLMTYDVLARHATRDERIEIMQKYRMPLLIMGILTGFLGAMPTFFWLSSIFILVLFPVVSMFMMWVYSLVFIFAALWFTHYLLFALKELRETTGEVFESGS